MKIANGISDINLCPEDQEDEHWAGLRAIRPFKYCESIQLAAWSGSLPADADAL